MAEYIEREALMATVNEWEFSIEDFVCFVQDLEKIPAADVAPVVHGEWVVSDNYYGDNAKCSVCGHEMCVNEPGNGLMNVVDLHYCPNCGTKMDGGKHETN